MVNVIPAPRIIQAANDGAVVIDAGTFIESGVETERAANWLRDGLARFAGITLDDGSGIGTRIVLSIGQIEQDLLNTRGVRADGGLLQGEHHSITITPDGIQIMGVTAEGVFRGATTLLQLVAQAAKDGSAAIDPMTIVDAPRLAWRGLSFDTVRCFHPVPTVKATLDLLALYKMNVFHFHLSDSEGWRFQVDAWPKLTEISGQTARDDRPGGYYTTEEFAEIVQYAADRYISVVPEFDSPGHTASVIAAYPELASDEIKAMHSAMQYLHPDQAGVADLLQDVFTAQAEQTNGAYLHIGGDEAIAMDHESFQRYIQMALPIARSTGKGIVAWQEAARGGLSEGDLVQWWIPPHLIEKVRLAQEGKAEESGWDIDSPVAKAFIELFSTADQDIPTALAQGASVIVSPGTQLYLDTKYRESSIDPAQADRHERVGMRSDNYGNGTVADSYNWDPFTIDPTIPVDRIAGVEAAIWCETIEGAEDLFFQLLPRLAGSAEKAWSEPREWEDHRARLAEQPVLWDAMGVTYFKSSVVW